MRLLAIGASGRTGQLVLAEAERRGHTVTALARDPKSLTVGKGITLIKGSPASSDDIERAIASAPAADPIRVIVVTLAANAMSGKPFARPTSPPRFMSEANANLLAAMRQHTTIQKIVIMAAFGVGDSFPNMTWPLRLLVQWSSMSDSYADHERVEKQTKASGSAFVIARPNMLADGAAQPLREWGNQGDATPVLASITRSSVAAFLLDAAENQQWDGCTPVITN